jgi:hypothetical protein
MGLVSHKEDVGGTLFWGYRFRNVPHLELNSAEAVIPAFWVKENIFRLTKTTTIHRLFGKVNSSRSQLALHEVIRSVPEVEELVQVESGLNGPAPSIHPFRELTGRDVHGSAQLRS